MDVNTIKSVYFIGAGGIGMSALVRYFLSKGKKVGGYDRTPSELTLKLTEEGADIQYDESPELIPANFRDATNTLVVYTAAMPEDHVLLQYFRHHGFTIYKRAQVLGMLTRTSKGLCAAGTHGKTTTSSMAAHLLYQSHVGCDAFLGGISKNYGTNLLLSDKSEYVVIEADEFDRSFLQLFPEYAAITAIDADHLDIYGTEAAYRASFEQYAGLVEHALVVKSSLQLNVESLKARVYTYSVGEKADFYADNVRVKDGEICFDFYTPESKVADIQLGVPVLVNVENSVAAMALAVLMGATEEELREGMRSFMGVYRRFNVHVNTPRVTYIDDYAHHPQELKATIDSVRYLFPERYVIGVFQPHLYSRTRDFADGFAEVLSGLDEVALLPIYPAREEPIEGVTSEWLMEKISIKRALVLPTVLAKYLRERVKGCIAQGKDCVVVTMGAGDISDQVNDIEKALQI